MSLTMPRSGNVIVTAAGLLLACTSCGPQADSNDDDATDSMAAESSGQTGEESDATTTGPIRKGVVDVAALVVGVAVKLSADGAIGEVSVPLLEPLPTVSVDLLQQELLGATSFGVVSQETGAAADLAAGMLGTMLDVAGAWTWEVNDARDFVTIRFVNETPAGLVLTPGHEYAATLSLTTNLYVERVPAFSFIVTVE